MSIDSEKLSVLEGVMDYSQNVLNKIKTCNLNKNNI